MNFKSTATIIIAVFRITSHLLLKFKHRTTMFEFQKEVVGDSKHTTGFPSHSPSEHVLYFSELRSRTSQSFRSSSGHVLLTSQWPTWRRRVRWWCRRVILGSCWVRCVTGDTGRRPARAFSSPYRPSACAFWSSVASCSPANTPSPRATNERCAASPMPPTARTSRVTSVPVTRTSHVTKARQVRASSRRFPAWESPSSTALAPPSTRRCCIPTASRPPGSTERLAFIRDHYYYRYY